MKDASFFQLVVFMEYDNVFVRVAGGRLEPIPATSEREAGHTLDSCQSLTGLTGYYLNI